MRVLVVDDSAAARRLLTVILERDPDISVAGEATNGLEAIRLTAQLSPDLITMDAQMPEMDGFEATRRIMREMPCPIVMVSAVHSPGEVAWSFKALEAGALTVLAKPDGPRSPLFEAQAAALVTSVKELSKVRVVTRRTPKPPVTRLQPRSPVAPTDIRLVAIGASTGGPAALAKILAGLDPGFPVPIVIVQHIGGGFDTGLVDWLRRVSGPSVAIATHGAAMRPGSVYVSPTDRHLGVSASGQVLLDDSAPIRGHRPSATYLFASAARAYGAHTLGIILTGIGNDGCDGLRALKEAGGLVLAQDRESSVVYGMPKAAVDAGLADRVVSLDDLPALLKSLVRAPQPKTGTGR
jgi:two-component system, chemotaxis family, protein-glutamate methylesterase/glutaminase